MESNTPTPAIRVGIGGWSFEPWRGNFYPADLPHSRELEYASRRLDVIEINSTYYSSQKPATFARWRDATPEGFVFSLKASRFATNRRVLADAGASVQRFVGSGIAELGPKLGPIVWQFAPSKPFDAADFGAFLRLLPEAVDGVPLRHVLDVRHASFKCSEYLALARSHGMATVFTDSDDYPSFADITGSFVYARMMRTQSALPEGCTAEVLDQLAACGQAWRDGHEPSGLPRIEEAATPAPARDVFMFFISGAKERAPAAAMALRQRLQACSSA
ncbi:uncharacterized protein YecE (DUF72 family) [Rhodoferax ferrireducens]|uniref:Uncharacterized protein YecE (DUF72 family) n=1 Tax=Rhodoferax ferrireducens TaxID=192843 RepID=A0ABU2C3D7_9BURK|nr:DUF72 domain-containing protein [Rhodoferax ferrireducens]MDR7375839.1 uncharacterized protein YecE (DUF72 family) [Rhodoferax ferrireducens]